MTTTTQSKAEYLKRYLDGGGTDASEQKRDKKEHKHKKHKRHHHHHHSGMRVIDADEVVAAGGREIYDEDEEEKPQLDEAAAALSSAAAEALRGESASAADAMALGAGRATIYRDKLGKKIEPSNTGGAGAGLGAQDDAPPARVKPTWGTGLAQQREKDEWREFARTTAAGPVARHDLDGEEPLMTSDDL
ncbi:hypothetical protein Ctob_009729 [Chrysochromulina tobinii]|uniref:Uncharacterized protein n=1 Tax=Chrysochromulina tobinii TaxID=1460289 RepID=A0A0M0K4N7_9EUKA|nr:hypothetical protein Ctob_009729 [Chrysochromulina tobinii]|eukprot:KOO33552.1 hypothetical protein Ctob_009729 [Chrysochromulina sp. CCMP291]